MLCGGKILNRKEFNKIPEEGEQPKISFEKVNVSLHFDTNGTNKKIIADLSNRLLFQVDNDIQKDMENLLKYDFDPNEEHANNAVLRLFNYITKTPEYQII